MMILEEILLESMYVLPSKKVKEIVVTREMIERKAPVFEVVEPGSKKPLDQHLRGFGGKTLSGLSSLEMIGFLFDETFAIGTHINSKNSLSIELYLGTGTDISRRVFIAFRARYLRK